MALDEPRRQQIRLAIAAAAVSRDDLRGNSPVDAWILACWDLQEEVDRLHALRSEDHVTFGQQLRGADSELQQLTERYEAALDAITTLTRRIAAAESEVEAYRAKEADAKARRAKLLETQRKRLARRFQGDVMSAPHDEPQF
jgi:septal ring factor EnvC (AmiA/AmiB activator)